MAPNNHGLSHAMVLKKQEDEGFNELPATKSKRLYQTFLDTLREPMVYLLVGCGLIYFLIGDHQEALMLIGFLALIVCITVFQENKAERALDALRDLSSPRALVLRDGKQQRIPGREVVCEDLVFVNEGDRIPADGKLLTAVNISVDESMLSGESLPVDKDVESLAFAGTTVLRGQGVLVVSAIGANTELGKIGRSLQYLNRETTRLEDQTNKLVSRTAWFAAGACILVMVVYALTRNNWLAGALVGLTLAMAIMPNELPAVLTIFLALGAWRMSLKRVLTRKLPAIENLGSTTVLCVDKTGTLTLNQMTIQKVFSSDQFFDLDSLQPLPEIFHEAIEYGILASRVDPFDPMELAFVRAGVKYLAGTEHLHKDWNFEKEYPLSPSLLSISQAWKPSLSGGFVIGAKGAPEAIIDLCHLENKIAENLHRAANEMARDGMRVIGIAKAQTKLAPLPKQQHDFDFSFVGLIGISDPVRPGVPKAISECRTAGIRVVMMTGDHPLTACSIARQIGLDQPDIVITGKELEEMNDKTLLQTIRNVSVFSRVMPAQKLRIVEALKSAGEIVAMTGDGVNDAPALKSAHIGIAMGERGTDVARESAALVLLDDDFGSIVAAIRMGRRVYANLRSALGYLLAVHVPIAGMSIIPVLLKMPLVLLPAHVALLHLIIEPASSIAFEVEPENSNIMNQPPRSPQAPLFDRKLWLPNLLQGLSITVALLLIYLISIHRGHDESDTRALVFLTLIVANLGLIVIGRSSEDSVFKKITSRKNPVVHWILGGSIVLAMVTLYIPTLREVFRFSLLHFIDVIICLVVGLFSVTWLSFIRIARS